MTEPTPRVEVLGTLREAGQVRTVLVVGLASLVIAVQLGGRRVTPAALRVE